MLIRSGIYLQFLLISPHVNLLVNHQYAFSLLKHIILKNYILTYLKKLAKNMAEHIRLYYEGGDLMSFKGFINSIVSLAKGIDKQYSLSDQYQYSEKGLSECHMENLPSARWYSRPARFPARCKVVHFDRAARFLMTLYTTVNIITHICSPASEIILHTFRSASKVQSANPAQ